MPKYSQLPTIQAIINSDLLSVLHDGVVYKISKADLFNAYLTEAQIDLKIQNIVGGGTPWAMDKQVNVTVREGLFHYPHNLETAQFYFQCDDANGAPIIPDIKAKTDTHISFVTFEEIQNCTLYFFG